jgi:hypothetical protein
VPNGPVSARRWTCRLFKAAQIICRIGMLVRDPWRVGTSSGEQPVIERASSADLAFLAMDTGRVPQQSRSSCCWTNPMISACLTSGS